MGVFEYSILWINLLAIAATCDSIWVSHIRPILARKYGWPDLDPDELIPAQAWIGALVVIAILFIAVPVIGNAAGF